MKNVRSYRSEYQKNRIFENFTTNQCQGDTNRVLCVCSAGMLRSPTAAWILSYDPWNFNTRSCGTEDYALIPLSQELATWATEIVCMNPHHQWAVQDWLDICHKEDKQFSSPMVHLLNIEDDYNYRDPVLVKLMFEKFSEIFK